MAVLVTKAQLELWEAESPTPETAQTSADAVKPLFPSLVTEGLGVLGLCMCCTGVKTPEGWGEKWRMGSWDFISRNWLWWDRERTLLLFRCSPQWICYCSGNSWGKHLHEWIVSWKERCVSVTMSGWYAVGLAHWCSAVALGVKAGIQWKRRKILKCCWGILLSAVEAESTLGTVHTKEKYLLWKRSRNHSWRILDMFKD